MGADAFWQHCDRIISAQDRQRLPPEHIVDEVVELRGIWRTILGFAAAMVLVVFVVRLDIQNELPLLESSPPREAPVAVVGPMPDAATMRDALNGPAEHPLAARVGTSKESAIAQLRARDVSAVIVLGPKGRHELMIASAASAIEAEHIVAVTKEVLAVSDQRLKVTDLVANGAKDRRGLGSLRLAVAWTILAVVLAGLLAFNFGSRSTHRRLVRLRFGGLAMGAVAAGLLSALFSDVLLARFDVPVLALAALGALVIAGVGAVTLAAFAWFGAWGYWATAIVVIGLGLPGAIGAWPLTALNSLWPTMLAWLPPGAATWGIRGLVYFDGEGIGRVVAMMTVWLVLGFGLTLLAVTTNDADPRLRRFHPSLRRAPFVSGFLGLVALAVLVVFPASGSINREDLSPALQVKCERFTPPTSVAQLNQLVNSSRSLPGFVGGDLGASTPVADGRSLFVFGDTIRQDQFSSQKMVRNSMLVFGRDCAGAVQRRDKGAVIPDRADGVGYWPMSIAAADVGGYQLVGVMAQRVKQTSGGAFGFENLGPALAVFRVDPGRAPVLQRVADIGEDDPSTSRPVWGAGATIDDGTVYLYGTSRVEGGGFGWAMSVAKVKLTEISNLSRWRYFDGTRWQSKPQKAAKLIAQDGGVSQTPSVFKQGDTWYVISKQSDFVGTDLVAWTAPSPAGPFTAQPPLAKIPSTEHVLRYSPMAHPELLPKANTMVVSISRNSEDPAAIAARPELYRPEFIRVRLP